MERRRLAYMKRIDPFSHPEEDDDDNDDEKVEEYECEKLNEDENRSLQLQSVVSIAVLDGPSEQKKKEIKTFLEQELPEIQKNVAVRARMLWFKQREYEDKLVKTRNKLMEVNGLIADMEPGLPPMSLTPETGITLLPSM